MKLFEYSPTSDVYLPYLQTPGFSQSERLKLIWESLAYTPLPFLSRWLIYRALKDLR